MAKMMITLVLDADRHTLRKVKEKVVYAAHKSLVSCSACFVEPTPKHNPGPLSDVWDGLDV